MSEQPNEGSTDPYGSPPAPPYGSPEPPPYGSPPVPYAAPESGGPTAPYPVQQAPGSTAAYPAPYPASAAGQWGMFPEQSQAVLAFVFGIISIFVFQPLGPFAWVIGNRELRAVDAGRRNPTNRGLAVAGKIMGIIGTVFLIIEIIVVALAIVFLVAVGTSSSTTST